MVYNYQWIGIFIPYHYIYIMHDLNEKRMSLLSYIRNTIAHTGRPPSIQEIGKGCGIKGNGAVVHHLIWLEKRGYIKREQGFRNIRILRDPEINTVELPLIGSVKAGIPNLAVEERNVETYLKVPSSIAPNNNDYFLLHVDGESMKGAGLLPGDIVIIKKGPDVHEGDIVVAVLEDEVTIKRLVKAENGWILMPENENFQPIVLKNIEEVFINGRVVGKLVSGVITEF
jgi:repressor LexA